MLSFNLSKREQGLMALVGTVAFVLMIKFLCLDPYRQLRDIKQQIAQQEEIRAGKQNILLQVLSRNSSAASTGTAPASLLKENSELSMTIEKLSSIENKDHTFRLTKIVSEQREKLESYERVLFSIDAETSYLSLGSFLEELEASKLLNKIESVEISRVKEDLQKCTAKIKLQSYVFREGGA